MTMQLIIALASSQHIFGSETEAHDIALVYIAKNVHVR